MAVSSSAKASMRSMVGMILSDGGGMGFRMMSRSEGRTVWFEADARPQPGPGKGNGIGRHGARCRADQQLFGDRLKIGAEVHGALVHENGLFGWLDPDIAKH